MDDIQDPDRTFARAHAIPVHLATAYRRGWEARYRESQLHSESHRHPAYAWYCAGYHDADISLGNSILDGREA